MAYLDILSQENYINVNSKAIKLFGRDASLHLAVLLSIGTRVYEKHTYDDNGFWTLKRKYVTDKIQLSEDEQQECEAVLEAVGILQHAEDNQNRLRINAQTLAAILSSEDTSLLKTTADVAKASTKAEKKKSKNQGIRVTMKRLTADLTPDTDLQTALSSWVDSVYDNKRFLNKDAINLFWQQITEYTSDKTTQLEILKTAILNGWKNASWIINKQNKSRAALNNTADLTSPIKY